MVKKTKVAKMTRAQVLAAVLHLIKDSHDCNECMFCLKVGYPSIWTCKITQKDVTGRVGFRHRACPGEENNRKLLESPFGDAMLQVECRIDDFEFEEMDGKIVKVIKAATVLGATLVPKAEEKPPAKKDAPISLFDTLKQARNDLRDARAMALNNSQMERAANYSTTIETITDMLKATGRE